MPLPYGKNTIIFLSVRQVCRFVRQHDLFYEYLTVEEHLYYQAILRIGDRPYEEIQNRLIWVCFFIFYHFFRL